MDERLVWLDLETTGTDPNQDRILEIAALVTTGDARNVIDTFHEVIHISSLSLKRVYDTPRVWSMHTKNGLLAECVQKGRPAESWAIQSLAKFLAPHTEGYWAKLAGFSVHFDREFLANRGVLDLFSHQIVEVSGMVSLMKGYGFDPGKPTGDNVAHRALDDARAALDCYRNICDFVARAQAEGGLT